MYIPTTFMASQGACFEVTTTSISGSGIITTGSFVSGGFVWDYYQFEMSDKENASLTAFTASLNILSGSTGQAKILIVGGGGTGGNGNSSFRTQSGGISYTTLAAGGGGAGGVVYYNQFPLSSGSYEIGIGNAIDGQSICPGAFDGVVCGKIGRPSYVKLTNNFIYTPFTSSFLTAYGGGGGAVQGGFRQVSPSNYFFNNQPQIVTESFASAGGAGGHTSFTGTPLRISPANSNFTVAGGIDLGGLNGADQGQNGGQWCGGGDIGSGYDNVAGGPGGGGAAASGSNLGNGCAPATSNVTNGGDGLTFNLTGTNLVVANGGGGVSTAPSNAQGVRGSSAISTYGSGGNATRGVATPTQGNGGVVIIAIPKCPADLYECTEYRILGGATGGTITYIPCGTLTVASASINTGYTGSVCTYKVGTTYPTSTGTVTLTQTGSCNSFIPLAVTQSCASGSVQTAAYIYDYALPIACYPTPSSCQRYAVATSIIDYVDYLGVSQSIQVGGGFGANTGQICAREFPAPVIRCGSVFEISTPCTITKTTLVCGYYCSGSI